MAMYNNVWITTDHTGKMEGMASVSTCRDCNKRCLRNASIKGSICEKCYAERMMRQYSNLKDRTVDNYKLLTSRILDESELPRLNFGLFRIESFGDIANTTQAINYLNMIYNNPFVHFGWWTKNCDILKKAIDKVGKPDNVQIVRSSLYLNKPVKKGYWFVDKVFTVYTKDFIEKNNIDINCGGRKCIDCTRCYFEGEDEIREKKK